MPAVTDIRELFGTACVDLGGWLRGHGNVLETRFDGPSALAMFSVRGLAGHLLRAMTLVENYVDRPAPDAGPGTGVDVISAAEYYATVAAAGDDLDSDVHRAIRQRGVESAPNSPADFVASWADTAAGLVTRLGQEPADRLVQVYGDLVLTLDEYLVTRLIELAVHADDLAASLDVAPPALPPAAGGVVIGTLVEVARIRHGDTAVVWALTRRERDAAGALRVL